MSQNHKDNAFKNLSDYEFLVPGRDGSILTYSGNGTKSVVEREVIARKASELLDGEPVLTQQAIKKAVALRARFVELDDGYCPKPVGRMLQYAQGALRRQLAGEKGSWLLMKDPEIAVIIEEAIKAVLDD